VKKKDLSRVIKAKAEEPVKPVKYLMFLILRTRKASTLFTLMARCRLFILVSMLLNDTPC
jgi:hypothetical protein